MLYIGKLKILCVCINLNFDMVEETIISSHRSIFSLYTQRTSCYTRAHMHTLHTHTHTHTHPVHPKRRGPIEKKGHKYGWRSKSEKLSLIEGLSIFFTTSSPVRSNTINTSVWSATMIAVAYLRQCMGPGNSVSNSPAKLTHIHSWKKNSWKLVVYINYI